MKSEIQNLLESNNLQDIILAIILIDREHGEEYFKSMKMQDSRNYQLDIHLKYNNWKRPDEIIVFDNYSINISGSCLFYYGKEESNKNALIVYNERDNTVTK